jgi:hypothetical protein
MRFTGAVEALTRDECDLSGKCVMEQKKRGSK